MIPTVLALIASAAAMQSDTTRAARETFTACLRTYVNRAVADRKSLEDFQREYPQQCSAQETAFREAIIRRESALRATRANAEEQAGLEVEDARINFSEQFQMLLEPR